MKGQPLERVAPEAYRNVDGRRWGGDRHRGQVSVSRHTPPLVREFFGHLNAQQTTIAECADRAGVNHDALKGWRTRFHPKLSNFEAVLNALDLDLVIVPRGTVLPAHAQQARQRALAALAFREPRPRRPKVKQEEDA
jgi:hypothetical protein